MEKTTLTPEVKEAFYRLWAVCQKQGLTVQQVLDCLSDDSEEFKHPFKEKATNFVNNFESCFSNEEEKYICIVLLCIMSEDEYPTKPVILLRLLNLNIIRGLNNSESQHVLKAVGKLLQKYWEETGTAGCTEYVSDWPTIKRELKKIAQKL